MEFFTIQEKNVHGSLFFAVSDTSADAFVAKLENYGMTLLLTKIPHDLKEEFIYLDLSAKSNVLLNSTVPVEIAELLAVSD